MERAELDEDFLTVAEVAEMLKLNQQTIRNWIDQGSMPALRVGRRVRIKRSDLDRLLADAYSGSTTLGPRIRVRVRKGSGAGRRSAWPSRRRRGVEAPATEPR